MKIDWSSQRLIYFIWMAGAHAIKIGFTDNLVQRLDDLGTATPFELVPVAAIIGAGMEVERTVHEDLKHHRLRGEWFDSTPAVWKYIEDNAILITDDVVPSSPRLKRTRFDHTIGRTDDSPHRNVVAKSIWEEFNDSPLTSRQRQVIAMRFGLDPNQPEMTFQQIADVLGVTNFAIQSAVKRGIKVLKNSQILKDLAS